MANLKASKKDIRRIKRRTRANDIVRSRIGKLIKKTKEIISKGDKVLAGKQFQKATKAIDKGAKDKVIHKNKASRMKSGLAKKINQLAK